MLRRMDTARPFGVTARSKVAFRGLRVTCGGRQVSCRSCGARLDPRGDSELVAVAAARSAGARAAFDELVRRHKDRIHRYTLHLLGGPGLADDTTQETFVRAWMSLSHLSNRERFGPWLRTIATRAAFNLRRARSTRSRYEERAEDPVRPPDPHALAQTDQLVLHALDRIPYAFREILVLRHVEDLSLEEIASTLQIGESAAKMRLKRARDEFMTHYLGGGDA